MQTSEVYERRLAILRRLGADVREAACKGCKTVFVDPEPLGGLAWKLMVADDRGQTHWDSGLLFCSESCVQRAFDKHRGSNPVWITGYEPPPRNQ